jgi:hypothetical protein
LPETWPLRSAIVYPLTAPDSFRRVSLGYQHYRGMSRGSPRIVVFSGEGAGVRFGDAFNLRFYQVPERGMLTRYEVFLGSLRFRQVVTARRDQRACLALLVLCWRQRKALSAPGRVTSPARTSPQICAACMRSAPHPAP